MFDRKSVRQAKDDKFDDFVLPRMDTSISDSAESVLERKRKGKLLEKLFFKSKPTFLFENAQLERQEQESQALTVTLKSNKTSPKPAEIENHTQISLSQFRPSNGLPLV